MNAKYAKMFGLMLSDISESYKEYDQVDEENAVQERISQGYELEYNNDDWGRESQ